MKSDMEGEYFDYEEYDQLDDSLFLFIDCVLKKDIGHHKVGEKLDQITIDYFTGNVQIWKDVEYSSSPSYEGKVKLIF